MLVTLALEGSKDRDHRLIKSDYSDQPLLSSSYFFLVSSPGPVSDIKLGYCNAWQQLRAQS